MQAALDPIAIRVAPRRHLAARHLALLDEHNLIAAIAQPFSTRKAGWTGPSDDCTHWYPLPFTVRRRGSHRASVFAACSVSGAHACSRHNGAQSLGYPATTALLWYAQPWMADAHAPDSA